MRKRFSGTEVSSKLRKFKDPPFDCGCPACRMETRKWQRKKDEFDAK